MDVDPLDRVRAQREYIEADDLARQAAAKVEQLQSDLKRWERIRRSAQALADTAFAGVEEVSGLASDAELTAE